MVFLNSLIRNISDLFKRLPFLIVCVTHADYAPKKIRRLPQRHEIITLSVLFEIPFQSHFIVDHQAVILFLFAILCSLLSFFKNDCIPPQNDVMTRQASRKCSLQKKKKTNLNTAFLIPPPSFFLFHYFLYPQFRTCPFVPLLFFRFFLIFFCPLKYKLFDLWRCTNENIKTSTEGKDFFFEKKKKTKKIIQRE